MATQVIRSPMPLWMLAANVAVNGRSHYEMTDYATAIVYVRAVKLVWDRLKRDGSYMLRRRMERAEQSEWVLKGLKEVKLCDFPKKENFLEHNVSELFENLRKYFELETSQIPVSADSYQRLLEDETLTLAWNNSLVHEFGIQRVWPENANEMKKWMASPENAEQLTSVKILQLSDLNLPAVFPQLSLLCGLSELSLSMNSIDLLPDSIKELTNLKTLILNENQIGNLPESLGQLTNLEEIRAEENFLKKLPQTLGGLSHLSTLSLKNNEIETVPSSFSMLGCLRILDLNDNRFRDFPDFIKGLTSLTCLNLGGNQIEYIPDFLFRLTKLESIDLGKNKITNLSHSFEILTQLKEIHLEENQLQSIPRFLSFFYHLTDLVLENNEIEEIPDSIGNLARLQVLNLAGNSISTLPDSLRRLNRLRVLNLRNNQISRIPDSLGKLTSLNSLSLGRNRISQIPEALSELEILNFLELGSNNIKKIPEFLTRMPGLKEGQVVFVYDKSKEFSVRGFNEKDNPLLFIFEKFVSVNIQILFSLSSVFHNYSCKASFSRFCQSLSQNEVIDREAFHGLDQQDQKLVHEMIQKMSGNDSDDPFEDVDLFFHAVRKAISEKFDRLSSKKKKTVYKKITEITGQNKSHTFDNPLLLIDTIEEVNRDQDHDSSSDPG